MLIPTGLCLVGAYAAAADESPAALALLARRLDKLLPPQLVRARVSLPRLTPPQLSTASSIPRYGGSTGGSDVNSCLDTLAGKPPYATLDVGPRSRTCTSRRA